MTATRRLAAILAADVVGYSRLIGADEPGTLARLRAVRAEVIEPLLAAHGGRVFKSMGDGLLAEFPSGVQAIECAVAVQQALAARADGLALRIGLHSADVVVQPDGDLLGDGVNVAARLEALAEPGGICLSDRVREDAAGKLSLDLEDLGERELKNIVRKVRVFRVRLATEPKQSLALPDKPSIAVLPFQNMSGDPEQEYFADGMVEDITTGLSRIGGLFVIARNSSFAYKGKSPDVRQVGRELGVRYVLEGSVRKVGGRVRITCQLINTLTGHHVWADRFDGALDDIFELQDRVTASVVGAIEPSLRGAEVERAHAKPTENLDAYDLYLRALRPIYVATRESLATSRALLSQALAIDPGYSQVKACLARALCATISNGWGQEGDRELALRLVREALADHRDDPTTLGLAGHVLGFLTLDRDQALAATQRAVALNPNSAALWSSVAWVHCYRCEPEPAIECELRAIRLSPRDPELGYFYSVIALAHLIAGDDAQAEAFAVRSLTEMPNWGPSCRIRIAALVGLGRLEEARAAAADYMREHPNFRLGRNVSIYTDQAYAKRNRAALRQAGFPE
jgi:adenylate cyclase